jgi:2-polyprenyl-3-methyl-5-hydroxy-6-metoxy-1,4-benzoquinol methylase
MADNVADRGLIIKQGFGFVTSKALHVAVELGIFDLLSGGAQTVEELADELDADADALDRLLGVLAHIGLVDKAGNTYTNSLTSETLLIRGKPGYTGFLIERAASMWKAFNDLAEIIRTGKPTVKSRQAMERVQAGDGEASQSFAKAMHAVASNIARQLVQVLDLSPYQALLDVGGSDGTLSICLAEENPGLKATVFDLPQVVPIAQETIREYGLSDRIGTLAGNWKDGELPKGYDVVLMSQVLHVEQTKGARELLHKAFRALPSGGLLITREWLMNAEKTGPWFPVIFNLNLLLQLGTQGFSAEELKGYIEEAGFMHIREIRLERQQTIVTATKP